MFSSRIGLFFLASMGCQPSDDRPGLWGGPSMSRSWKGYVSKLCNDRWQLSPHRTQRVVDDIEFLIATDQLSEVTVTGVLTTVGMRDPWASNAAKSIQATIRDCSRAAVGPSAAQM